MSLRAFAVTNAAALALAPAAPAMAAEGDAPTWFDPAETPSVITPFMMLYALHDAVVKPMPGALLHRTVGLVPGHAFSYPYEDIRLEPRRPQETI